MEDIKLVPIGVIRSTFKTPEESPRQGRREGEISVLEVFPRFVLGLKDIDTGRSTVFDAVLLEAILCSKHTRKDDTVKYRWRALHCQSPVNPAMPGFPSRRRNA